MIGLRIIGTDQTYRWASDSIRSRGGHFFDGRLMAPQLSSAHVDRWLPTSSRLSRSTFSLRDQDGSLLEEFKRVALAGRTAELLWITREGEVTLGSGVVRRIGGGPGKLTIKVEDPALLRFGAALTPILSDVLPTASEDLAGNLVPQVYGRATRLPVAGGMVDGSDILLVACLGDREVTNVRYDGELLDKADWTAEVVTSTDPPYTRIRVSGETDRDLSDFEWSGGERMYSIAGMIQSALLQNGVLPAEIDSDSFNRFDDLVESRGLASDSDTPEGALVITSGDETLASIIGRIQNSWGVLLYLDTNNRFRIGFPIFDPDAEVLEINAEDIEFGAWSIETPEGATEWVAESDRAWSRNNFNVQRMLRSVPNLDAFGAAIRGRVIQQWYARGRSAENFATDRILLERWDYFRGQVTLAPYVNVQVGSQIQFRGNLSTLRLPDQPMFVDGISVTGSGFNLRRQVTLTPLLGIGTNELVATVADVEIDVSNRESVDYDLEELFQTA